MRSLQITLCGNRYEFTLDDELALFVEENLASANLHLDQDNKADKLLLAYLKLAKQNNEQNQKITNLLQKLEI